MKTEKRCKDCGAAFVDEHDLFKKCVHCRERDQCYRERGIRENMPEATDDDN